MDIDDAKRFLHVRRLAVHSGTPEKEREAAKRRLGILRNQHPGIDRAADLLQKIEDGDLAEPPPPPPPPGPDAWGGAGMGGGLAWGALLSDPVVAAALQSAAGHIGGRMEQAIRNMGGGLTLPEVPKKAGYVVDVVEGGEDDETPYVALIVRASKERLYKGGGNQRMLERILGDVTEGLGFEEDEDD
jgi:hypothetical protein